MADPKDPNEAVKDSDVRPEDKSEEDIDDALDDSFPASDPPAYTSDNKTGSPTPDA